MQAADVFELGVDICQLGLDQRKVNMLAREYAANANAENAKPDASTGGGRRSGIRTRGIALVSVRSMRQ